MKLPYTKAAINHLKMHHENEHIKKRQASLLMLRLLASSAVTKSMSSISRIASEPELLNKTLGSRVSKAIGIHDKTSHGRA